MQNVVLQPKHARTIARGHPWVYRQAVARRPKGLRMGAEVIVRSDDRPFVCRGIWDPEASVAVRAWTLRDDEAIDEALFARRFREARQLRKASGLADRCDAFRVVHAEGDRMPGVLVDRWGEWLTLTLQSAALRPWRDRLVNALRESVPAAGIYVRTGENASLVAGEPCPEEHFVREPTCEVRAFPDASAKSGVFTDMREARVLLAPMLAGRSFLNLFAHTGAFSAAAARAGATEVASVDLSGPYLDVARQNVERSAPGFERHEIVKQDVFDALKKFARDGREFDAILIDPPTFSSSHASGTFTVAGDYRTLVRAALRVLSGHGILACATNFRGTTREEFVHAIHDAAAVEERDLRVLTTLGQPSDHPVPAAFPEFAHLHFVLCGSVPQPPIPWRP